MKRPVFWRPDYRLYLCVLLIVLALYLWFVAMAMGSFVIWLIGTVFAVPGLALFMEITE